MPEKKQYAATLPRDVDVGGLIIFAGDYTVHETRSASQEVMGACLFRREGFDTDQIDLTPKQFDRLRQSIIPD